MKKLFSWATSLINSNKLERLVLTKQGAFMAAWITIDEGQYTAFAFDQLPGGKTTVSNTFTNMDEAKHFADQVLKAQGFSR